MNKIPKYLRTNYDRKRKHTTSIQSQLNFKIIVFQWYVMIYLLTAIGFPACGSSTVHIYTQTIRRTTQNKQYI